MICLLQYKAFLAAFFFSSDFKTISKLISHFMVRFPNGPTVSLEYPKLANAQPSNFGPLRIFCLPIIYLYFKNTNVHAYILSNITKTQLCTSTWSSYLNFCSVIDNIIDILLSDFLVAFSDSKDDHYTYGKTVHKVLGIFYCLVSPLTFKSWSRPLE